MIADSAFVAGSHESAAGFFPAVTVSGEELGRGEDMFLSGQAFEQRATVDSFPAALEFDGAGRGWRCGLVDSGGGGYSVIEVADCYYSGDTFGFEGICKESQPLHGDLAAFAATMADFGGMVVNQDRERD